MESKYVNETEQRFSFHKYRVRQSRGPYGCPYLILLVC